MATIVKTERFGGSGRSELLCMFGCMDVWMDVWMYEWMRMYGCMDP